MENDNQVNEPISTYGQSLDFQPLRNLFAEDENGLRKLDEFLPTPWSMPFDMLVNGGLFGLMKKQGLNIDGTFQQIKGKHQGERIDYDIIAYTESEIVVVDVKTTLQKEDVKDFHNRIQKARAFLHHYKDKIIYGAMAFIAADGASERMAENLGFFVIRATGSSSSIINSNDFKPKAF